MTKWSYGGLEKVSVHKSFVVSSKQKSLKTPTHNYQAMFRKMSRKLPKRKQIQTRIQIQITDTISIKAEVSENTLHAMIIKMFRKPSQMRQDVPPSAI